MYLFVSDLHLGRGGEDESRSAERDIIACVRRFQPDLKALFLLGDVFEQFIEHRRYVPKGFPRFIALLTDLVDSGVAVHYLVGNHDPWHQSYFESEIGIRLHHDDLLLDVGGLTIYSAHGDGKDPSAGFSRNLRKLIRHPVSLNLYRLLPADLGFWLAKRVSSARDSGTANRKTVESLRRFAHEAAVASHADLVVMGHSHYHELFQAERFTYLNTGYWFANRTFGILQDARISLNKWENGEPVEHVGAALAATPVLL